MSSLPSQQKLSLFTKRFVSPFRRRYKKGGYHCDLCHCFVGWTEADSERHESGRKHKKLIRTVDTIDDEYLDCSDGYCGLCQTHVFSVQRLSSTTTAYYDPSSKTVRKHVNGKKHKSKWRAMESKLNEERLLLHAEAMVSVLLGKCLNDKTDALLIILQFAGFPTYP